MSASVRCCQTVTLSHNRDGLTRATDANEYAKLALKQGKPPIRRNEQHDELPSSKLTIIKLNSRKFSPMIVGGSSVALKIE